jgi:hypothetical protein
MILLKLAHTPAFAGYRAFVYLPPGKGEPMPRQKSLFTVIRDLVQQEVRAAMQSLFGSVSTTKTKPKNGRRRRRRPRGPGRPPGSKNKKA